MHTIGSNVIEHNFYFLSIDLRKCVLSLPFLRTPFFILFIFRLWCLHCLSEKQMCLIIKVGILLKWKCIHDLPYIQIYRFYSLHSTNDWVNIFRFVPHLFQISQCKPSNFDVFREIIPSSTDRQKLNIDSTCRRKPWYSSEKLEHRHMSHSR